MKSFNLLRNLMGLVVVGWVLSACAVEAPNVVPSESAPTLRAPGATATAVPFSNDIAKLLASPPPVGTVVELDAYYLRSWDTRPDPRTLMTGTPVPMLHCSTVFTALTDSPMYGTLHDLLGSFSNVPMKSEPYLVAVTPAFTQPQPYWGSPGLPYHARLRGRFGDPAFADCDEAARMFVVENLVQVYQLELRDSAFAVQLPADVLKWARYEDRAQGFSIAHPLDWTITLVTEPNTVTAVALTSPRYPDFPVTVRVFDNQNALDGFDQAASLLGGISSYGQLQQGERFGSRLQTQKLTGERAGRQTETTMTNFAVFKHDSASYVIELTYPLGSSAPQDLISTYLTMVESFRLDN